MVPNDLDTGPFHSKVIISTCHTAFSLESLIKHGILLREGQNKAI